MKPRLLFTHSAIPFILRAFGMHLNADDLIIEDNTGEPALTAQGEMIKSYELGGFIRSRDRGTAPELIKNDIFSIMELAEREVI